MSMIIKTTKTLPTIDLADQILAKCGWLTPYSSSQIFAEFKNVADGEGFTKMNPDSFILCVEVGLEDEGGISYFTHFEAMVNKGGDYWLVMGIEKAKPIHLGDLPSVVQHLFSDDGRKEIINDMVEQYKKGWGEVLVRIGFLEWMPIVLVPRLTTPSGWGASTYDAMETREEVIDFLKRNGDVCVRNDLSWPKNVNQNMVVQVIDLQNEEERKDFTVVPVRKTVDHSNNMVKRGVPEGGSDPQVKKSKQM